MGRGHRVQLVGRPTLDQLGARILSCCPLCCPLFDSPESRDEKLSRFQGFLDGPGRDRTCDLGIKSLEATRACGCKTLKVPAPLRNPWSTQLRGTACHGDESVLRFVLPDTRSLGIPRSDPRGRAAADLPSVSPRTERPAGAGLFVHQSSCRTVRGWCCDPCGPWLGAELAADGGSCCRWGPRCRTACSSCRC